jgi:phosphatidylglycerol---prolipoprotein diacylglyceryl transferase
MFPVLQVGSLSIQVPGLILLLGIWLGFSQVERFAAYYRVDSKKIDDLVMLALIAGVVSARLSYVLRFPSIFHQHWLDLISLDPHLFDVPTGLLIGVLAGLVYGQKKKMPFLATLDAMTPGMAVFFLALGLAHLSSGEAYGSPTQLPWGIWLWGAMRHPTQIMEILLGIGILRTALPRQGKNGEPQTAALAPGLAFFQFLALICGATIFVESFRGDTLILWGRVRVVQVGVLFILGFSLWWLRRREKRGLEVGEDHREVPDR